MKIISAVECGDWLKTNLGTNFAVEKLETTYACRVSYLLPNDTGKKTTLGRTLAAQLKPPGIFWITATGIWPSSENMELFDAYRRSLGENRSVNAAPAHIFGGSDLKQLECLVDLSLYFYWDAFLIEADGTFLVKTSHDEYVSAYARNHDRLRNINNVLLDIELKQLSDG